MTVSGRRPKVIFYGSPTAAVPSLKALLGAGVEVVAVVTQRAERLRRGTRFQGTAVSQAAREFGIQVFSPTKVAEILPWVRDSEPDVGAIVAYGQIIPKPLIDAHRFGIVNLHFSVLPRWRGAAPVQRAILAGDEKTGVCTMLIDEGLDTGPLLTWLEVRIREDETAGELEQRLARLGAPLLVEAVSSLVRGTAMPRPQPNVGVSVAKPLSKEECEIDWSKTCWEVERLVRAANPRPGAWTRFRGRRLEIVSAKGVESLADAPIVPGPRSRRRKGEVRTGPELTDLAAEAKPGAGSTGRPGEVLVGPNGCLFVRCGVGLAWLIRVKLEGRDVVSGEEFSRGARFRAGELLGDASLGSAQVSR